MRHAGRKGDRSHTPNDTHGCPDCPHSAIGPAVTGSANVLINTRPALRVGDSGIHSSCCGDNSWRAYTGASRVLVNNKQLHRQGDVCQHGGAKGRLAEGSANVLVGDLAGPPGTHWTTLQLTAPGGHALADTTVSISTPDGETAEEANNGYRGHHRNKIPKRGIAKFTITISSGRKS